MGEVIYGLNGKLFRSYGIGISKSDGIGDFLKPKPINSFSWPEYHGKVFNATQKAKYEPREIVLIGWVRGDTWDQMTSNFNTVFGEFKKAGKQRLTIDIKGQKTRIYDVVLLDGIKLEKTFSDGVTFGTFSIKMVEYLPIKKILKTTLSNLQLAFNVPSWVEISIDGKVEYHNGTISINKSILPRSISNYEYEGRNLLKNTDFKENVNRWNHNGVGSGSVTWNSSEKALYLDNGGNGGSVLQNISLTPGSYTISFDMKPNYQSGAPFNIQIVSPNAIIPIINGLHVVSEWRRYSIQVNITGLSSYIAIMPNSNQRLFFKNIKLEKNSISTQYEAAPEDVRYISIAGNIDDITNFSTNADVLWEEL